MRFFFFFYHFFFPFSFTIKWNNDPTAAHYLIELYSMDSDDLIVSIDMLNDNSVVFSKLLANGSYRAIVRAQSVRSDPTSSDHITVSSDPSTIESTIRCDPPPSDVILGVDSSRTLGSGNLSKVKKMFIKIINKLEVSLKPDGNRISGIKYGPDAKQIFGFNKFV